MEEVYTTERLDELFGSLKLLPGDEVWLVGGGGGLQTRFLLDTYPGVYLRVFEPQMEYYFSLVSKFSEENVYVYPFALGGSEGEFLIGLSGVDATLHWRHLFDAGLLLEKPTKACRVKDVSDELKRLQPPQLLFMNCEGSELDIISRLDQFEQVGKIPYILAQVHSRVLGFEGCEEFKSILEKTHEIKWRYNTWAWVYAERLSGDTIPGLGCIL